MDSQNTPNLTARRSQENIHTDGRTELAIVVLNELACAGAAFACGFSGADYVGATPVKG
jgi:hypothetical protein